jgi:alpha-galactosidase
MICNRLTDKSLPVIFNEYMFASWNDPSFETALSLAPVAKKLGADYFVIDCGWHDEEPNPFYHVGKWEESKTKYPDGLMKTLDYVRSLGLKVGLWLEPEVVGYFGNAKDLWTDDCFFQRNGKPLIISNRYQLDFRNEFVYKTLMDKITSICKKYKIDYFKFDYNIEPGIGTDFNSDSLGDGLLENNRCYKRFIDELGSKFPNLIIESCASGGNRLDYSTLDNVNLASTSDQTDYKLYPYIISNLLTAILPEQAGVWSYPRSENMKEEDIDLECIAMNMINSMIGRIHLASKLYLLDQEKQKMIKDGIDCYNYLKEFRENCVPYYPIGLSNYKDKHLAFGYQTEKKAILFLYNMSSDEDISIKLNGIKNVKVIYPLNLETQYNFKNEFLTLKATRHLMSRVFELEK